MAVQSPLSPLSQLRALLLRAPEAVLLALVLILIQIGGVTLINALVSAGLTLWFLVRVGLIWYGQCLLRQGRYRQTLSLARIACWLNPWSADSRWLRGISAYFLQQPLLAVQDLQRACRLDPGNAGLYAALSAALIEAGQPQEAVGAARQALAIDPHIVTAYLVLGEAEEGGDQIERYLLASLSHARHPAERATTHWALAFHLLDHGHGAAAAAHLNQAMSLLPACPPSIRGQLHYRIGELLAVLGEPDRARAQFRASVQVDPRGPRAAEAWRAAALGYNEVAVDGAHTQLRSRSATLERR